MGDIPDNDDSQRYIIVPYDAHCRIPVHIMGYLCKPLIHSLHIIAAEENTGESDKRKGKEYLPSSCHPRGTILIRTYFAPVFIGNYPQAIKSAPNSELPRSPVP